MRKTMIEQPTKDGILILVLKDELERYAYYNNGCVKFFGDPLTYVWSELAKGVKYVSWFYYLEGLETIPFRWYGSSHYGYCYGYYGRARVRDFRFIVNPVGITLTRKKPVGFKWLVYRRGYMMGHGSQPTKELAMACAESFYNKDIAGLLKATNLDKSETS